MKVYSYPESNCTYKVLITLQEKNLPYELINVDLSKGEQKEAHHLALHPFGVIPVLDDEGFILYESRAIMRYLDAKFRNPSLTPSNLQQFGEMEQWISIEQSYFSTPALVLIRQFYFNKKKGLEPDPLVVEAAKPKVEHVLNVAEKRLSKTPYFAGENFSLADITWIPCVEFFFPAGFETLVNTRPNLKAWWEKVSKRESVLKTSPFQRDS